MDDETITPVEGEEVVEATEAPAEEAPAMETVEEAAA
jgi:hypothetical protein